MLDVAIAGGGLAGAACAAHLAAAGAHVTVLERSRAPGRKACGEGLFPRGLRELAHLGIAEQAVASGASLEAIEFHAAGHVARAGLGDSSAHGLGIQRGVLDALAADAAERAGAEIRAGATVRSLIVEERRASGFRLASGEMVRARVCIAADGLHSPLRRQARLANGGRGSRYGVSAHVALGEAAGNAVRVWFEHGYELYLTPVGESVANVALLCRRPFMRRFTGGLRCEFEALLGSHDAFAAGFSLLDQPLAAGPFAQGCSRAWRANFLLAGDAAGFFDGITGEGMSAALASGRLAAQAALTYLETGSYEPFRAYQRERSALVRNTNLLGRIMLGLAARPVLAGFAVRNLSRQPEAFDHLIAISAGEAGLRSLRPGDALALGLGL